MATIAHLQIAVEHRTVIGQATGILIERFGMDADAAFAALSRTSQDTNRTVHELAIELVETGHTENL